MSFPFVLGGRFRRRQPLLLYCMIPKLLIFRIFSFVRVFSSPTLPTNGVLTLRDISHMFRYPGRHPVSRQLIQYLHPRERLGHVIDFLVGCPACSLGRDGAAQRNRGLARKRLSVDHSGFYSPYNSLSRLFISLFTDFPRRRLPNH